MDISHDGSERARRQHRAQELPATTAPNFVETVQSTRFYKLAGKIYHDDLIGTKIRLQYGAICLKKRTDKKTTVRTVLCYPDKPDHAQMLFKICNTLGCKVTSSIESQPDLVIAFQDVTRRACNPILTHLAADHYVVNYRCDDISKVKVEEAFRVAFGYGTFIDPTVHVGLCVMKSDENAMHDGLLAECPVAETRTDVVYQKIINNVVGEEVQDIRVPIIKGAIPFVYLKYRSRRRRFSNVNARVTMHSPETVLSEDDIASIKRFAETLGLDYGELDVLRDTDDGKIYVVDVNNTPCGPPNHLSRADCKRAVQLLSERFSAEFFAEASDTVPGKDVR